MADPSATLLQHEADELTKADRHIREGGLRLSAERSRAASWPDGSENRHLSNQVVEQMVFSMELMHKHRRLIMNRLAELQAR